MYIYVEIIRFIYFFIMPTFRGQLEKLLTCYKYFKGLKIL